MIERITQDVGESYLTTGLWAETNSDDYADDNCPPPWNDDYDVDDFSVNALYKAYSDCRRFVELLQAATIDHPDYDNLYELADGMRDDGTIGHDFWLTRNGHGAGFWDGDYDDDYGDWGDCITKIVNDNFAECYIYSNGDGTLGL